jgi:hypothetical protein
MVIAKEHFSSLYSYTSSDGIFCGYIYTKQGMLCPIDFAMM